MTHPYRASIVVDSLPRWTSTWARFAVRVKRLFFFWTLAARRREWREGCRYLEYLDRLPEATERVEIRADNGSVVKNVYIGAPRLSMVDSVLLYEWRKHGRRHVRMPRA